MQGPREKIITPAQPLCHLGRGTAGLESELGPRVTEAPAEGEAATSVEPYLPQRPAWLGPVFTPLLLTGSGTALPERVIGL